MMAQLTGEGGEAGDSIRRLQEFDPNSLVRESDLGSKLALRECVDPARRVIDLFKLISPSQIDYFPQDQKNLIRDSANAFYNLLQQCLKFEIEGAQPTPTDAKNTLIQQITAQYQPLFNQLYPLISFAIARSQDFAQLEREARAATQAARDSATEIVGELNGYKSSVETILIEARTLAAEQGVGKQAIYFKSAADEHATQARIWLKRSMWTAIGLASYALMLFIMAYVKVLQPENGYQTTQLILSKILIFTVIAYMLLLCARNFLSHTHNEVVNRHRQNALATFTTLTEAASDKTSSDIVLTHAAACIFAPQETGYAKQDGGGGEHFSGLQLIPALAHAAKGGV